MRRSLLILLLVSSEALARVGGGEGFGGAGGGGGASGGGFSGGGDGGWMLYLLLRLLVDHPAVGVPVIVILVAIVWHLGRTGKLEAMIVEGRAHGGPTRHLPAHQAIPRDRIAASWAALLDEDPGLSRPVLEDRIQLVVRRAHEQVGQPDPRLPAGATTPQVHQAFTSFEEGVSQVDDVVIAGLQLTELHRAGGYDTLSWTIRLSRREARAHDRVVRAYCEEAWTFRRRVGAASRSPEEVHRLGCPSCGSAEPTDAQGRCPACGTIVGHGELEWQATDMTRTIRRTYRPFVPAPAGADEEPGYRMVSARHPDLATQVRAFQGRHPDLSFDDIEDRLRAIFLGMQAAWSAGRWEEARPWCTDIAWTSLRFGLAEHEASGVRNRVEDVRIEDVEVVRITLDAWYEAITLRIRAHARDWFEDRETGAVVGGNPNTSRAFAEYWTFLRAVDAAATPTDPRRCPSCGAPVDRVDFDGVCGYCDSVITTGRYDWVLSRIEQPEVFTP